MDANLKHRLAAVNGSSRDAQMGGSQPWSTNRRPYGAGIRPVESDLAIVKRFLGTFSALGEDVMENIGLKPQRIRELCALARDFEAACAGKPRDSRKPNDWEFGEMERAVFVAKREKRKMEQEGRSLELTDGKIREIFEKFVSVFGMLEKMDAQKLDGLCEKNGIREIWRPRASDSREEVRKWGYDSHFWYLKQMQSVATRVLGGECSNSLDRNQLMRIRNIVEFLSNPDNVARPLDAQEQEVRGETAQKGGNALHRELCAQFRKIPSGWLGARSGLGRKVLDGIENEVQRLEKGDLEGLSEDIVGKMKSVIMKHEEYLDAQQQEEKGSRPKYDERFDFGAVVRVGFGQGRAK